MGHSLKKEERKTNNFRATPLCGWKINHHCNLLTYFSILPTIATESFASETGWTEAADDSLLLDRHPISEESEDADNNNTTNNNNNNNKTRKRRKGRDSVEDHEILDHHGGPHIDPRLIELFYPKQYEAEFATAIFEVGLKNSSPKVLMALMPSFINLSTEHLKSHLQKVVLVHNLLLYLTTSNPHLDNLLTS